jgi:hypothetical protein
MKWMLTLPELDPTSRANSLKTVVIQAFLLHQLIKYNNVVYHKQKNEEMITQD